jgi:hypothetical protein
MTSPPYFKDKEQAIGTLEPVIKRYHESGRYIHFCTINTASLIEATSPPFESVDRFKYREDILRVLYSLVSSTGLYYEKSTEEIVLAFATSKVKDCDFLTRHLVLTIGDFFPKITLPGGIVSSTRSVRPDEAVESALTLFS